MVDRLDGAADPLADPIPDRLNGADEPASTAGRDNRGGSRPASRPFDAALQAGVNGSFRECAGRSEAARRDAAGRGVRTVTQRPM